MIGRGREGERVRVRERGTASDGWQLVQRESSGEQRRAGKWRGEEMLRDATRCVAWLRRCIHEKMQGGEGAQAARRWDRVVADGFMHWEEKVMLPNGAGRPARYKKRKRQRPVAFALLLFLSLSSTLISLTLNYSLSLTLAHCLHYGGTGRTDLNAHIIISPRPTSSRQCKSAASRGQKGAFSFFSFLPWEGGWYARGRCTVYSEW